jgi:hypothetical protein
MDKMISEVYYNIELDAIFTVETFFSKEVIQTNIRVSDYPCNEKQYNFHSKINLESHPNFIFIGVF